MSGHKARVGVHAVLGVLLWVVALPAVAQEQAPPHETLVIQSSVMAESRRINVYLPPQYDRQPDASYPVLYMPDGGVQEDFPHVASMVDKLIRAHQIRPLLVVGIENTQRRRDMTGPTDVEADRKIAPQVGGSQAFREFIASELMPAIRSRYRTSDESAIIGESLAGLFIVETLFLKPELFDAYVALDPSLWWNDKQWLREAAGRLDAIDGVKARLLLATGDRAHSGAAEVEPFAQALQARAGMSLQLDYIFRPDLRHETIYRGLERDVLVRLFGQPTTAPSAPRTSTPAIPSQP